MSFLARAQVLAGTDGLGGHATAISACAYRTGIDPWPLRGLTGTALVLGAGVTMTTDSAQPYATDRALLDDIGTLDMLLFRRERQCTELRDLVLAAIAGAPAGPEGDGQRADAQAALDVLAEVMPRLRYARMRLTSVPAALAKRYEAPQRLVRSGGVMPFDGRWITGERGRKARERLSP